MTDIDNYKKGSDYETFIHRANRKYDNSKPGTHGSTIENLILVEKGDTSFVRWHGSRAKQFEKAKNYIHKAMDKYLKMKNIPPENLEKLETLKYQIDSAYSSDDLMTIIRESIELTQCVRNY